MESDKSKWPMYILAVTVVLLCIAAILLAVFWGDLFGTDTTTTPSTTPPVAPSPGSSPSPSIPSPSPPSTTAPDDILLNYPNEPSISLKDVYPDFICFPSSHTLTILFANPGSKTITFYGTFYESRVIDSPPVSIQSGVKFDSGSSSYSNGMYSVTSSSSSLTVSFTDPKSNLFFVIQGINGSIKPSVLSPGTILFARSTSKFYIPLRSLQSTNQYIGNRGESLYLFLYSGNDFSSNFSFGVYRDTSVIIDFLNNYNTGMINNGTAEYNDSDTVWGSGPKKVYFVKYGDYDGDIPNVITFNGGLFGIAPVIDDRRQAYSGVVLKYQEKVLVNISRVGSTGSALDLEKISALQ
jgi:hypothetical protein